MRRLQVFNGRGDSKKFHGHLYVCAETKVEAVRLLQKAGHTQMTLRELNWYWSHGVWGTRMDALEPVREKGVWFVPQEHEYSDTFVPRRLL